MNSDLISNTYHHLIHTLNKRVASFELKPAFKEEAVFSFGDVYSVFVKCFNGVELKDSEIGNDEVFLESDVLKYCMNREFGFLNARFNAPYALVTPKEISVVTVDLHGAIELMIMNEKEDDCDPLIQLNVFPRLYDNWIRLGEDKIDFSSAAKQNREWLNSRFTNWKSIANLKIMICYSECYRPISANGILENNNETPA